MRKGDTVNFAWIFPSCGKNEICKGLGVRGLGKMMVEPPSPQGQHIAVMCWPFSFDNQLLTTKYVLTGIPPKVGFSVKLPSGKHLQDMRDRYFKDTFGKIEI